MQVTFIVSVRSELYNKYAQGCLLAYAYGEAQHLGIDGAQRPRIYHVRGTRGPLTDT